MPAKTIVCIGNFLSTQAIVSDSIGHIPIPTLSLSLYRQIFTDTSDCIGCSIGHIQIPILSLRLYRQILTNTSDCIG